MVGVKAEAANGHQVVPQPKLLMKLSDKLWQWGLSTSLHASMHNPYSPSFFGSFRPGTSLQQQVGVSLFEVHPEACTQSMQKAQASAFDAS